MSIYAAFPAALAVASYLSLAWVYWPLLNRHR